MELAATRLLWGKFSNAGQVRQSHTLAVSLSLTHPSYIGVRRPGLRPRSEGSTRQVRGRGSESVGA